MYRLDRQGRRLIWRRAVWVASLMAVVAGAPVARRLDGAALTERLDAVAARIRNEFRRNVAAHLGVELRRPRRRGRGAH